MKNIAKIMCFVLALATVFAFVGVTAFAEEESSVIPDGAIVTDGTNYYTTLADAIAAIGSGDVVIELLADATFDYGARMAYGLADTTSVTINGNGHVLSLNQRDSDWGSIGLANPDATLIFNDVVIEKIGYGDTNGTWNSHALIISSKLEMNDVTVNQSLAVQKDTVLNNVTINEANGYYGLWITADGQSVTFNGGSITATNGGRGVKIADEYREATAASVTLNISDVKFNTAKKAAVLVSSVAGAEITATNLDIANVAEDSANIAWVDDGWATSFGKVTVNGGAPAQENAQDFAVSLVVDGKVVANYTTFQAAINAASHGNAIMALADGALNETVTLPNGFMFIDIKDENGKLVGYGFVSISASPEVAENGNWSIGGFDLGMVAYPKVAPAYCEEHGVMCWFVTGETECRGQAIGVDGTLPTITEIDGYWYIDNKDGKGLLPTGVKAVGTEGLTITSVHRDTTKGDELVSVYVVTFSNGYTWSFSVTNGVDGIKGLDGAQGPQGPKGPQGPQGIFGKDGNDNNQTVVIVIAIATICLVFTLSVVLYRGVERRSWWCTR